MAAAYVSPLELAGGPTRAERRERVDKALRRLHAYFIPRRIFLPRDVANQVALIRMRLLSAANEFSDSVDVEPGRRVDHKAWDQMFGEVGGEAIRKHQQTRDEAAEISAEGSQKRWPPLNN